MGIHDAYANRYVNSDSPSGKDSPLLDQVGGDHYKTTGSIQPIEFILANNLNFCEGSVVKYIFRWRKKNGIEDLRKAKHYIEILIEEELKKNERSGKTGSS
jgi:Protein of unknwon function (DUF3310)